VTPKKSGGGSQRTSTSRTEHPKLYYFTCDYVSKMHGDPCTTRVQAVYSAKVAHTCIDGKRKLLTRQDD
jgi:hypothetical protein